MRNGYFFDSDDSFPLEDGRTAGSYSTFFNEFFLISNGFFYLELNSVSDVTAKASRKSKSELYKLYWLMSSSFLASWVNLFNSSTMFLNKLIH